MLFSMPRSLSREVMATVATTIKGKRMELRFKLKGLNCPNCAKKIETEIGKLDFVLASNVDIMAQEIALRVNSTVKDSRVKETVCAVVARFEPDVEVIDMDDERDHDHDHGDDDSPWRLRRLVAGGIVAIVFIMIYYIDLLPLWAVVAGLLISYIILGGDVLYRAVRNILRGRIFDENFLMALATIGAIVIGEYPEAVAVMLFYQIGELFQDRAVDKSRRNIKALMDIRPDMARVVRDGNMIEVAPDRVAIGEEVVVKPGERIPLDGVVCDGDAMLDMRALTGESKPKHVASGDEVLSGAVNTTQVLTIKVARAYAESTATKILELVQKAGSRKAKAERFMTIFARYYTPIVVLGALLLTLIPVTFLGGAFAEWINRSLVFLVISCPCALVISVPLTFFGGIGAASRSGILVKGGNYLDALNHLGAVVFDKTGTLTVGNFNVTAIEAQSPYTEDDVLNAALTAEQMSNHPIARSISACAKSHGMMCNPNDISKNNYTELSGRGVKCTIGDDIIYAGNEKLMREIGISYMPSSQFGTLVYVAKNDQYLGCISICDEIKSDAKDAISDLRKRGIEKCVMLTGDSSRVAQHVAQAIGLDEYHANMLPGDKVSMFESIASSAQNGKKTAFVGDGVNDAPVLARADIGIAMGGIGSDAAIEAADIVFMDDDLAKLPKAIDIACRTKQIVMQNIVFAITVKIAFLALGAFAIIGMWSAVFADVGVMVIAVLNATRMIQLPAQ